MGCGAKTGLYLPDADTGVDTGIDAGVDSDIPCIEIPEDGGPIDVDLTLEAEVGRADVVFLIDVTASMTEEISQIRNRLRDTLAPEIQSAIPDSQLAVATFADFPVEPFGGRDDTPFNLRLPATNDIPSVQAAVNGIELGNGVDGPESQVEALYQLATGEGIGSFVPPSAGCPMGGVGYACLRNDALPVVLLFTDALFHNGPGGADPYTSIVPPPHSYGQAVDALNRTGMRVIGFDSGDGTPRTILRRLARDTGAVAGGDPLVFDIGVRGERLGSQVVEAIRTFASNARFDIDAVANDPDPGDGVDVLAFIDAIRPLGAEPMSGIESIDTAAGAFRGVVAGTRVTFQIVVRNDAVVPGPTSRSFVLEIVFRGDGRTRLGREFVELLIPGEDGSGCDDLGE